MSVFESLAPPSPTAQQGAVRVKRMLAQPFQQIEASLAEVRRVVERHGRSSINSALGADQKQVVSLYKALKTVVEQNRPGTSIPDLPN